MTWGPVSGEDNGPAFSEPEPIPTLEEIRQNLLEVRDHTHFNIGSPQAIDHLLVSIVAVIDAIVGRASGMGNGGIPDPIGWGDDTVLDKLSRQTDRDPTKYNAMITVSEANQAAEHIRRLRDEVARLMLQCESLERRNEISDDMVERAFIAANEEGMEDPSLMVSYAMIRAALTAAISGISAGSELT